MEVSPDEPWAAYGRTVVEIRRPGEADIVVRPAPPGRSGGWPWESSLPVQILTVWDPGEERTGDQENRVQQAALEADLRNVTRDLWSAVGVDPLSGHREEGVAVRGVSDAVARVPEPATGRTRSLSGLRTRGLSRPATGDGASHSDGPSHRPDPGHGPPTQLHRRPAEPLVASTSATASSTPPTWRRLRWWQPEFC